MMDRYFDFRIIVCPNGTEIIDRRLKTAYKALTQKQILEYAWLELELEILDKQEQNRRVEGKGLLEI